MVIKKLNELGVRSEKLFGDLWDFKMHYSTILCATLCDLHLHSFHLAHAIPEPIALAPTGRAELPEAVPFPSDEGDATFLEDAFETIASILENVLDDGPEAVKQWALAHQSQPHLMTRSELQEIAEILLGITDVVNDCFSF
ncbi:MAG: hypothetical protein Q9223_001376 [Gallowayella weberi]